MLLSNTSSYYVQLRLQAINIPMILKFSRSVYVVVYHIKQYIFLPCPIALARNKYSGDFEVQSVSKVLDAQNGKHAESPQLFPLVLLAF